eukprot:364664-Chlamydomonas_euryale.AAC.16
MTEARRYSLYRIGRGGHTRPGRMDGTLCPATPGQTHRARIQSMHRAVRPDASDARGVLRRMAHGFAELCAPALEGSARVRKNFTGAGRAC